MFVNYFHFSKHFSKGVRLIIIIVKNVRIMLFLLYYLRDFAQFGEFFVKFWFHIYACTTRTVKTYVNEIRGKGALLRIIVLKNLKYNWITVLSLVFFFTWRGVILSHINLYVLKLRINRLVFGIQVAKKYFNWVLFLKTRYFHCDQVFRNYFYLCFPCNYSV